MINAFLHVVVDVVITCISATWMESSSADKYDNTAQKTLHVHTPPTCFMSDMTLDIGLERK